MFDDFSAKNTVYTMYIFMILTNPMYDCVCVELSLLMLVCLHHM